MSDESSLLHPANAAERSAAGTRAVSEAMERDMLLRMSTRAELGNERAEIDAFRIESSGALTAGCDDLVPRACAILREVERSSAVETEGRHVRHPGARKEGEEQIVHRAPDRLRTVAPSRDDLVTEQVDVSPGGDLTAGRASQDHRQVVVRADPRSRSGSRSRWPSCRAGILPPTSSTSAIRSSRYPNTST